MSKSTADLIGPTRAANILGVSAATVINWAKREVLPAVETLDGRRLFVLADVDQLARRRKAAKERHREV